MRSDDERRQPDFIFLSQHTLDFSSQETPSSLSSSDLLSFDEPAVPLSIFSTSLSAFQALVRYLHDHGDYSFTEIGRLLNRSQKTIWASYQQARHLPFSFSEGGLAIPLARFASRQYSPLETIVTFLGELGFSNVEIARALNLDPRTTWTAKKRAAEKKGVRKEGALKEGTRKERVRKKAVRKEAVRKEVEP